MKEQAMTPETYKGEEISPSRTPPEAKSATIKGVKENLVRAMEHK